MPFLDKPGNVECTLPVPLLELAVSVAEDFESVLEAPVPAVAVPLPPVTVSLIVTVLDELSCPESESA